MDQIQTLDVLREMLREQVCCIGRIATRHKVPDDVVWEIVKGFDVLYERMRRRIGDTTPPVEMSNPDPVKPHPGIVYLMEKLDREEAQ
jgi:hypothetical protein